MPSDRVARHPVEFRWDNPGGDLLAEAAAAVRQEARAAASSVRLNCTGVSVIAERGVGVVFMVQVDRAIAFDWSWEGARASGQSSQTTLVGEDGEPSWTGEIVEVDELGSRLFVAIEDGQPVPQTGCFTVRPFEFLAILDALFHGPEFGALRARLPARLRAAEGGVHPNVQAPREVGKAHLMDWWSHAWSILWGPPGAGKTWTSGQQLARVLADPTERVLVVSTTNRATDAIALSIGEAVAALPSADVGVEQLVRAGQGADPSAFEDKGLDAMLASVDVKTLGRIALLKHQLTKLRPEISGRSSSARFASFKAAGPTLLPCSSLRLISGSSSQRRSRRSAFSRTRSFDR